MTDLLSDPVAWSDAQPIHDRASIQERLPQRHEMALLDAIVHHDSDERLAVAVHDVPENAFWVRGHIPGRPLMPGVVMVECAAQLSAWLSSFHIVLDDGQLFGFGGVDRARFRGQVLPGQRMVIASRAVRLRASTGRFLTQAFVGDQMVYQGEILGIAV